MVEYTKFICMTRRLQSTCKVFFPVAYISSSIDLLLLLTSYFIFMKNSFLYRYSVNFLNITSKFCINVNLQLSIYKQYFIHTVQMFMMYLCTKYEVYNTMTFQFFPHQTGRYRKHLYCHALLFYILKYTHNRYIFSKVYYNTSLRILNYMMPVIMIPTSQILTYATLLLMLVGNWRIVWNGHRLYNVHTTCLENSPMVQDLKVGWGHRS